MKIWLAVFYLLLLFCGSLSSTYLSWKHDFVVEAVFFLVCSLCSLFLVIVSCMYGFISRKIEGESSLNWQKNA